MTRAPFSTGVVLLWAATALADGPVPCARLSYRVEAGIVGCPDERQVRDAVAVRLGRAPFDEAAALGIDVQLAKQGDGLTGTMVVTRPDGSTGRRTLHGASGDCAELAASLELAISLVIDPSSLDVPPPEVRPASPAPTPEPNPKPPAPVEVVPASANEPVAFALHAGVVAAAGQLPGFSAGASLGASALWPRFGLTFDGRVHLPTTVTFSSGVVSTLVADGSVVPCLRLGPASACGVATVGLMHVAGATARATREVVPLVLLGVRGEGVLALRAALAVVFFAEVRVVVTRVTLAAGDALLWSTWPVAPSAGAVLRWTFP